MIYVLAVQIHDYIIRKGFYAQVYYIYAICDGEGECYLPAGEGEARLLSYRAWGGEELKVDGACSRGEREGRGQSSPASILS